MKRTLLLPSADGDDDDNNNESPHPADKRRLSGQDYPESAAVHESPTDDDDDGTVIIDILSMNDDELKEFGNDIEADQSVSTLIDDKESLIDCDDEELGVDDQESPDNSPSMITDQINKENSEAPLGFSGFVRTHDAMAPGPFLNSEPSQDGGHVIVKPIVVPGVAPHSLPIPNLSNWMNTGHRIFFSPYTMFDGHPMMPPALRGSPLPGATSFYQPSPMAPHMNPGGRCFGPRIIQGNPWSIPRMSREQFNKPCMPPNDFMNFMETGGFRATNGPQPPPPLPPPSAAAYMASSNASNMAAAQALAAVFSQPIPERFQHYHHPQHQRQAPPGFVNQIRKRFPVMSFNREKCENRRSRPRREDGNYIKKPLNAFMLFMREERPKMIDRGSLRESAAINKILGRKWHGLSREEQAKYYEMAREERVKHMTRFPGWSARDNYGSKKRRRSTRDRCRVTDFSTPEQARKCRARYGSEKVELWCKACRRKKKCIRFSGLENEAERPLYDPSAPTHDKASCDSNKENPAEDDHAIIQDEAFIASSPELLDICTDVSGEDDDDDNDNHSSPNGTLIPTTQDHEHSKYLEQT